MMVEILSRIQFAFSVGFHFLFVPLSIGLIFLVCIYEYNYLKSKNIKFKHLSEFYGDMFVINYAFGIVTGFTMSLQFGTNWSAYSLYMGDVFGAPLVFEAIIAFFLESTFTGLWIFKKNKMSQKLRFITVLLIFIGTNFSALWIITANGFMQNPIGYSFQGQYSVEVSTPDIIADNTIDVSIESVDTLGNTYVTLSNTEITCMTTEELLESQSVAEVVSVDAIEQDDSELVATENEVYTSNSNALVSLHPIADDNNIDADESALVTTEISGVAEGDYVQDGDIVTVTVNNVDYTTEVTGKKVIVKDFLSIVLNPYAWYMLIHNNLSAILLGAYFVLGVGAYRYLRVDKESDESETFKMGFKPANILLFITALSMPMIGYAYFNYIVPIQPVKITAIEGGTPMVSIAFSLMVGLGTLFILYSGYTLIFFKKYMQSPTMQKIYLWTFFLPYIAILAGWMVAEVGRQPYVVYGQMLTADAVSTVPVMQVWFSLITIIIMYSILAVACVYLIKQRINAPLIKQEHV